MMDPLLRARLSPLLRRLRLQRFAVGMAACWAAVLLLGCVLLLVRRVTGWMSPFALPMMMLVVLGAAVATARRLWRSRPGFNDLAGVLERRQPELKGVLLTAVQQHEERSGGSGLNLLQRRVVLAAVRASHEGGWRRLIPLWQVAAAQAGHAAVFVAMLAVLGMLRVPGTSLRTVLAPRPALEITPGDVDLEKGGSLVVLARFGVTAPVRAELVVWSSGEKERRLPLVRSLSDPVFGASFPEVSSDLRYRVDYDGATSREFRVTVFEHPRLERSDADLNYPSYTHLEPKHVEDTRRVSAVEGTGLDLTLQLNKPVVSATLVSRSNAAPDLTFSVGTNQAVAFLRGHTLTQGGRYDLVLVDADGRTNKVPSSFVLEALPNRTPELKIASPRGDIRPSPLEEIAFSGTVWDDFGIPRFGLAYTVAAGETRSLELGTNVPAGDKRTFQQMVRLEDLGVRPDDLVSWYVWAEDIGPDGQVRRTQGDLFFAEVRPYDEVFREGESSQGESQSQSPQGTPATRLAELEKQIINATWRLQRRPGAADAYAADAAVVRDSQKSALEQAKSERDKAEEEGRAGDWKPVLTAMEDALDHLKRAAKEPAELAAARASEEKAYQALLRMSVREISVTRGRNQGQGGGESAGQRQLDQLDLKQPEDRYETQRQAQAGQNAEQREQLQILNRLRELARRQEDLNERLKELQTALQEARTEQEREEARRQLKRLQEEQREMVADVDELRQRMDRPENQSRMADERRQLDATRDEIQRAAEAADQGATSQAVAAGTRAQRQLESLRDDLRKDSANQFSEDLKQLRQDARDLARRQDEIRKSLDSSRNPSGPRTLTEPPERQEAADQLARQRSQVTNLVERATQVSKLAEDAEPLVSQKLYDTLRKFQQEDAGTVKQMQQDLAERGQLSQKLYQRLQETAGEGGQTLEMASELLRQGNLAQADRVEQRARTGIGQFRDGVEQAAESVLGDDTEALRRAAGELDALTSELQKELAQQPGAAADSAKGGPRGEAAPTPGAPEGERSPEGSPSREPGSASGNSSGEPGQAGTARPGASPQGRSEGQASTPPGTSAEPSSSPAGGGRSPGEASGRGGQGGRAGENLNRLAGGGAEGEGGGTGPGGPLTGGSFAPWSDRLREVEEIVDSPDLRAGVAGARERARLMRLEYRRDQKKPDWAVVRLQVLQPLVEVRQQIAEELARRGSRDALVPIDRDPVPNRYTELVRRYYEELGKDH